MNVNQPGGKEDSHQVIERQLTLLIEASATLLASPESANVLKTILSLAKRFVEADAYSVWRKAEKGNTWKIAAREGLSENYAEALTDFSGEAQRLPDKPLVIEDIDHVPFIQNRTAAYQAEGIRSLVTVPLRIHGEVAGTIVFYYRSPHRFTELEARVAAALGNLAAAALGTADLYDRETRLRHMAEAEEQRSSFLAEAGSVLASSLDYESTLASVVDLAVPSFADWASVDILEPSGEVRRVSVKHSDPAKIKLAYEYRRLFPRSIPMEIAWPYVPANPCWWRKFRMIFLCKTQETPNTSNLFGNSESRRSFSPLSRATTGASACFRL